MARWKSTTGRSTVLVLLLVLVGGSVMAAPSNALGRTVADQASTERTVEAGSGWRQVTTGADFACGIRLSGRLRCWGRDSDGAVGDGGVSDLGRYVPRPTPVAGSVTSWLSVDASWSHACAISTEHRLYCWGANSFGALGVGSTDPYRFEPTEVDGQTQDWASVSAGGYATCARKVTGRLFCWGDDRSGTLGDGAPNESSLVPVEVAGARTDWADVSVGLEHACAITAGHEAYCWGADSDGAVGDVGTDVSRPEPTVVAGGHTDWQDVELGPVSSCATRGTGRLFCWGRDGYRTQQLPVEVRGSRTDWTHLSVGSETCAGRTNGRLYCWQGMRNPEGGGPQLTTTPREVAGGHTDWTSVSVGVGFRCGLRRPARLFCWGSDSHGQIGDGAPRRPQAAPVRIP